MFQNNRFKISPRTLECQALKKIISIIEDENERKLVEEITFLNTYRQFATRKSRETDIAIVKRLMDLCEKISKRTSGNEMLNINLSRIFKDNCLKRNVYENAYGIHTIEFSLTIHTIFEHIEDLNYRKCGSSIGRRKVVLEKAGKYIKENKERIEQILSSINISDEDYIKEVNLWYELD